MNLAGFIKSRLNYYSKKNGNYTHLTKSDNVTFAEFLNNLDKVYVYPQRNYDFEVPDAFIVNGIEYTTNNTYVYSNGTYSGGIQIKIVSNEGKTLLTFGIHGLMNFMECPKIEVPSNAKLTRYVGTTSGV